MKDVKIVKGVCPIKVAEIFRMLYVSHYSYKKISEMLNLKEKTVRSVGKNQDSWDSLVYMTRLKNVQKQSYAKIAAKAGVKPAIVKEAITKFEKHFWY